MIIGKDFVILNMSKTGTCFRYWVADQYNYKCLCSAGLRGTKVISKFIYRAIKVGNHLGLELQFKHRVGKGVYKIFFRLNRYPEQLQRTSVFGEHAGIYQVSSVYDLREKEVLSVLRNPYSQAVSHYQYVKLARKTKTESYNFEKFVIDYHWRQRVRVGQREDFGVEHIDYPLGLLSYWFIRLYFKDPAKIFAMSAEEFDEYCVSDDYKEDMHPIKFFRTEAMNRQLYEYLKSKPYLDSQIIDEIFKEAKPKNVSKKREDAVWDDETKAYFEKTEKFYIRMVKELAPLPEDDF